VYVDVVPTTVEPRFHTYDSVVGDAVVGGLAAAGDHTPATAVKTLPTAATPSPDTEIVGVGAVVKGKRATATVALATGFFTDV
jgi:hypothetical protein